MEYQDVWLDCINKLDDLGYDVSALDPENLPSIPLNEDSLHGPLLLRLMNNIVEMETILNGETSMAVELTPESYELFAFQRGFLTYGNDEILNMLLAINFIIDELQMNRVQFYRRSQMKEELISPNKNIPAIKQRIMELAKMATDSECTSCEDAFTIIYDYCEKVNPVLLDKKEYSEQDKQKLQQLNQLCENLYHDKKIMMIQRLDVTIQSLLWDQRIQFDSTPVIAMRNEIDITHTCTLDQIFEARYSLLNSVCKVSTSNAKTKAKFRGIRIRDVPDRGGRVVLGNITDNRDIRASYRSANKRVNSEKEEVSEKINKPMQDFNETQKVLQVFGSSMNPSNIVYSSNKSYPVSFKREANVHFFSIMQCIHKIALVTGAASGFGFATAKSLVQQGFKVACCDSSFIHKSPDPSLVDLIHGKGNTLFCGMDPLSVNDVTTVLDTIRATYGEAPSVIVNCERQMSSEEMISKTMESHSLEGFQEIMERNVSGDFNVIRLAAREMLHNKLVEEGERGVIINTSSISAINGSGYQVAYSTAMAAISGMTLPLARALGRYGIRCVGIQPGLFDIPEVRDYADTYSVLSKMTPFPRRLGTPEEFAKLVDTIIWNPMLNGCNLRLDGGIRSSHVCYNSVC